MNTKKPNYVILSAVQSNTSAKNSCILDLICRVLFTVIDSARENYTNLESDKFASEEPKRTTTIYRASLDHQKLTPKARDYHSDDYLATLRITQYTHHMTAVA